MPDIFSPSNVGEFSMSPNDSVIVIMKRLANCISDNTSMMQAGQAGDDNTALKASVDTACSKLDDIKTLINGEITRLDTLGTGQAATTASINSVKGVLDTISTYVDGLETNTAATTAAVNSVKTAIDVVKTGIDSLNTAQAGTTTAVTALGPKLDTVHTDVQGVQTRLDDVKTALATAHTDSQALGTLLTGVQSKLDTSHADSAGIQMTLTAANLKLDSLNTAVGLLHTDFGTLQTAVSGTTTAVNNMSATVHADLLAFAASNHTDLQQIYTQMTYGGSADMSAAVSGNAYFVTTGSALLSIGIGSNLRLVFSNPSGSGKTCRIIGVDAYSSVALQQATYWVNPTTTLSSPTTLTPVKRNPSGSAAIATVQYDTNGTAMTGSSGSTSFYMTSNGRELTRNFVVPANSKIGVNIATTLGVNVTLGFYWYEV